MTLSLKFENEEYISIEKVDKIRVKFMNTEFYLKAKDGNIKTMPDNYEVVIDTPS